MKYRLIYERSEKHDFNIKIRGVVFTENIYDFQDYIRKVYGYCRILNIHRVFD